MNPWRARVVCAAMLNLCSLVIVVAASPGPAKAATADYDAHKQAAEAARRALSAEYARATTPAQRAEVIGRARTKVLSILIEDLAPVWYGTPWRFSGRTATPGEDAIACGTFVGTLLRDAGFRLNRIRMGRLASEHIALSLTSNDNVRRYRRRRPEAVVKDVEKWGPGLYMLGLDYHAALIYVDPSSRAHMLHSSYYRGEVIMEPLVEERAFRESQYRVIARLLDDRMVVRWLSGARFVARAS